MLAQQAAQAGNAQAGNGENAQISRFFAGFHDGNGNDGRNEWQLGVAAAAPLGFRNKQLAENGTLVLNGGNNYSGIINFNGGNLNTLVEQGNSSVLVVDNSGKYRNVRLGDNGKLDAKKAEAMAADFNASGAILLSALLPQETGYWNPAVITDTDGKATLTLNVPERSTAWKFLAKGLTAETLAGEATDDLLVKKDLFGEIKLPLAFTDGDTAEIPVTVHNDAIEKGTIEVVLRTTIGGRKVEETKHVDCGQQGIARGELQGGVEAARGRDKGERRRPPAHQTRLMAGRRWPGASCPTPPARRRSTLSLNCIVRAAGHEDIVERSIPLKPYGVPVFHAASGSGTSDQTVWVDPPEGMPAESAGMQIIIGPTVQRSLMDIVLAPAPWCQLEVGRLASGLESATSDAMASLGLQKLLGASRDSGGPEAMALDGRIRGSISLLLSRRTTTAAGAGPARPAPAATALQAAASFGR